MNLGKISAKFLRGTQSLEILARDQLNIHDPQGKLLD